jgi:hypothetical protein
MTSTTQVAPDAAHVATVLTAEQRSAYARDGVVKIPGAVSLAQCTAAIDAIWEFIDGSRAEPESWYRMPVSPVALIDMFHHQALWDNRQDPLVHRAFAELYGTEKLWVDLNRVSLKPPPHPDHPDYDVQSFIHWDIDTSKLDEVPVGIQAVIYLSDVAPEQGPFQCIPELYRELTEWVARQPAGRNPYFLDPSSTDHVPTTFPGGAGDLILFDNRMPHGVARNSHHEPRFAQYVLMSPERSENAAELAQRITDYRDRTTPVLGGPFWGDPRNREQERPPAELTSLGRRLLGLDSW